jgi:hypothetical protein
LDLESVVFEEVRLEGDFPETELVVLFRSDYRPELLFGVRERIWSDDGACVTDGPAVIATNVEETITFEPGLPLVRAGHEVEGEMPAVRRPDKMLASRTRTVSRATGSVRSPYVMTGFLGDSLACTLSFMTVPPPQGATGPNCRGRTPRRTFHPRTRSPADHPTWSGNRRSANRQVTSGGSAASAATSRKPEPSAFTTYVSETSSLSFKVVISMATRLPSGNRPRYGRSGWPQSGSAWPVRTLYALRS